MKYTANYDPDALPKRLNGLFCAAVEEMLLPHHWGCREDGAPQRHWKWLCTAPIHEIEEWAYSVLADSEIENAW